MLFYYLKFAKIDLFMDDRYGFNPRKYNSARTLCGCLEREMSKVIIALPTSNEVLDK